MQKARAERGFIAELDGLRGIAILLVMVHRFWPRSDAGLAAELAGTGWIGVDLFFVISGFLITGILLDTRGERTYFRNFYVRRVLRIFPLYYLFVGTILLVFWSNPSFRNEAGSPLWYLFYLGNMPEGVLGHDVPYWLGPVWSLAIEEQFYLTFPWLVALVSRKRLIHILVGILAFAPLVRVVTMLLDPAHERVQYLFTLCRIDTIAFGCLLAIFMQSVNVERHRVLLRKVGLGVLAGVALVAVVTGLDRTTTFGRTAGYSVVGLGAATVVMLAMLARGDRSTAALRNGGLRYFGKLCFGLYLLHRPADTIVGAMAARAHLDASALWLIPIKIVVALVFATISWRLLEQPILSLKSAFGGIRHPGHGGGATERPNRLQAVVRAVRQVALMLAVLVLAVMSIGCHTPSNRVDASAASGMSSPSEDRDASIDAVRSDAREPVQNDASTILADARPPPDTPTASIDAAVPIDAANPPDAPIPVDAFVVVPDAAPPPPPPPTAGSTVLYVEGPRHSPITPALVSRLQAIAANGQHASTVFAKVGDSITAATDFMRCYSSTTPDLGSHGALSTTIDYFRAGNAAGSTPFGRESYAAVGGTMASDVLAGSPSPLERELSAINPSIALVMFGTNEVRFGRSAEEMATNLWTVVDTLIARGVVPVMSTIPPMNGNPDADSHIPQFNRFIRAIAQGRGVPLVDFYRDMVPLANRGISSDGIHPSTYPSGACVLTSAGLAYGYNTRNLIELEALARVRAALGGNPTDSSAPTRAGTGTSSDPYRGSLPLMDLGDTRGGESNLFAYACSARMQLGHERLYRLDLNAQTTIDAYLVDRGSVDADVQILTGSTSGQDCVAWGNGGTSAVVGPGTVYVVIDTPSPSADGEYLLVVNAR